MLVFKRKETHKLETKSDSEWHFIEMSIRRIQDSFPVYRGGTRDFFDECCWTRFSHGGITQCSMKIYTCAHLSGLVGEWMSTVTNELKKVCFFNLGWFCSGIMESLTPWN